LRKHIEGDAQQPEENVWYLTMKQTSFVCCSYETANVEETYNRKKEKVTKKLRKKERNYERRKERTGGY